MPEIEFEPRYELTAVRNPDLDWLREILLDPFRLGRVFGEARIIFRDETRSAILTSSLTRSGATICITEGVAALGYRWVTLLGWKR